MKVNKIRLDVLRTISDRMNDTGKVRARLSFSTFMKDTVEFKVNWCCQGETDVEDTLKFAREVEAVAKIAEALNKLQIEVVRGDDTMITSEEEYDKYVEFLSEFYKIGSTSTIEMFLSIN